MFLRLKARAAPAVLLVLSTMWMTAAILLLLYSLLFPNADIKHIVRALEGREALSGDVSRLIAQVTNSAGLLKRAIPIGAYWGGSAEFKIGQTHTTKTIEIYYLAWFERRSRPIILIVTRTEEDGSSLSFYTHEGTFFGGFRLYFLPSFVMALSVYWFRRERASDLRVEATHSSG